MSEKAKQPRDAASQDKMTADTLVNLRKATPANGSPEGNGIKKQKTHADLNGSLLPQEGKHDSSPPMLEKPNPPPATPPLPAPGSHQVTGSTLLDNGNHQEGNIIPIPTKPNHLVNEDSQQSAESKEADQDSLAIPGPPTEGKNRRKPSKYAKFKCDRCDTSFSTKFSLKRHYKRHNGEKPHACTKCKKSFAEKSTLERHMRIHSGDKPFKCKWVGCEKSFADRTNVRRHMLTHTGERPFKCKLCEKDFIRRIHLTHHVRKTHKTNNAVPVTVSVTSELVVPPPSSDSGSWTSPVVQTAARTITASSSAPPAPAPVPILAPAAPVAPRAPTSPVAPAAPAPKSQ